MKDTCFLILTRSGISDMKKTPRSIENLRKGEIPVKLKVTMDDSHFGPPYIEKEIMVEPWDKGIEIKDVHFETDFVTEEEAEMIRKQRIENARAMLEKQGYKVSKDDEFEQV